MKELIELIKTHKNTLVLTVVFTLAGIGIACAMVAHYFGHPFNWKWFVFLDCPLYAFVVLVFYKMIPMIKNIVEMEEKSAQKSKRSDDEDDYDMDFGGLKIKESVG